MLKIRWISYSLLIAVLLSGPVHAGQARVKEPGFFTKIYQAVFGEDPAGVNLFDPLMVVPSECSEDAQGNPDQKLLDEYSTFKGHVNACVEYLQNHPEVTNFYESKKCINVIAAKFKAISGQACKDKLMEGNPGSGNIFDYHQAVLDGFLDNVIAPTQGVFNWDNGLAKEDPGYKAHVEDYFSLVGTWYRNTREELYPLTPTQKVISQNQDVFVDTYIYRKFWDELQDHSPEWAETFGQVTAEATEEELFQIFETVLSLNQKVIGAAIDSELAAEIYEWEDGDADLAPSPVLAGLLGDSLAPFFERVRTLTRIYDVACKLKSCDEDFYDGNETVWMLRFFNKIGQGELIEDFGFDEGDTRPLALFLGAVYDSNEVVKKIVTKMNSIFGATNVALVFPGSDFPSFLKTFHRVFAESHDLVANYESTKSTAVDGTEKAGFFHGGNISQVNVGFGKVNMDQHIATVSTVNEQLRVLSNSFESARNQLINETISINQSTIVLSQMRSQIEREVTEVLNLKSRLDAVRNFIHDERKRLAGIANQIDLGSDEDEFTQKGGAVAIQVPANTSNAGNGTFFSSIGSIPLTLPDTLERGDLLQITVSGEYQPNCAITGEYGDDVAGARTGPRGFATSFVNGKSKVRSTNNYATDSTYESQSVSIEACSGIPLGGAIEAVFGISTKACASASAGSRRDRGTTTSDSSSESTRSDASFDLGLTLANTPYPTAPVGSLLLVEMAASENNKWKFRSIRTLTNSNTVVAKHGTSDATQYFLVVNDCASASNADELSVTVRQYRPADALKTDFVNKVTEIIPAIEDAVADLVENGVLSQQLLGSLRSTLETAGGVPTSSFPGNVRVFLQAFLDIEIAILDYKSQVSNMERELENRNMRLTSLIEHYGTEGEQKKLKVGQRNWNLANMDLDFVNTEGTNRNLYTLNRILRILDQNLVSYLDFRFDEERKRAIVGNTNLLTRLNFASPFEDIALNITTFMSTLLDNLQDDLNNKPVTPKLMMGIHIPNPNYVKPVGFPDPIYDFPVMDDFRAKKLWDQIYAWKRGEEDATMNFDLIYEDLYAQQGLACYVEAPIIDSFGFYFVPENEGYITDFNNLYRHRNAKLHLDGLSDIPFENNPRRYNFTNDDWRFMDSAVRMAKSPRDAIHRLATEFPPNANVETGLGTGRSPFGNFQIGDVPAYKYNSGTSEVTLGDTPLDEIKELFIAYTFAASSNDFNVNLGWMNFCAPGGEYWKAPFRNVMFY